MNKSVSFNEEPFGRWGRQMSWTVFMDGVLNNKLLGLIACGPGYGSPPVVSDINVNSCSKSGSEWINLNSVFGKGQSKLRFKIDPLN